MPRTVVLGGGISGLATAHFLARDDPGMEVLLLEAAPRLGGTLGSERVDGFVLERGPHGFLDNAPETLELVRELDLGQRLLKAAPAARNRYIYKGGRLHALPDSLLSFLRTPLLSFRGRLRVLQEPLQRRGGGEEDSVASFGRRRVGEEATRVFLDPLVSGVFAGDVERLSLPAAFPRLAEMEARHGSVLRAMIQAQRARRRLEASRASKAAGGGAGQAAGAADGEGPGEDPPGRNESPPVSALRSTLCSFPGGLEEMVAALVERLGSRVRREWAATALLREGNRWVVVGQGGAREVCDAVVAAVPAYRMASLLHGTAPELSLSLEAIPYSPIAVVCLGFPREAVAHPLDGFGFLVPRDQGLRLLGTIWASTIYPAHAPPDMVSLRSLVGGARDPDSIDCSDDALHYMVLEELRPLLGLREAPTLRRVYRYTKGIPQYNLGHVRRVETIERHLWSLPGLFITGNAYRGVGINDCVREARRKARAVLEYLRR